MSTNGAIVVAHGLNSSSQAAFAKVAAATRPLARCASIDETLAERLKLPSSSGVVALKQPDVVIPFDVRFVHLVSVSSHLCISCWFIRAQGCSARDAETCSQGDLADVSALTQFTRRAALPLLGHLNPLTARRYLALNTTQVTLFYNPEDSEANRRCGQKQWCLCFMGMGGTKGPGLLTVRLVAAL